jgi:hypothetical protein
MLSLRSRLYHLREVVSIEDVVAKQFAFHSPKMTVGKTQFSNSHFMRSFCFAISRCMNLVPSL